MKIVESDDDVDSHVNSVSTIDNLLYHIENHLKDDIIRPFHRRYINKEESRMFLQKICFLDPRYKSTYIDPNDIDSVKNSIKLEMDEIGNQAKGKELKVQKNDGMYYTYTHNYNSKD